eukprot:Skav217313  [mRNA]  locus=scaffold3163:72451:75270:+ [translate_table: standard]
MSVNCHGHQRSVTPLGPTGLAENAFRHVVLEAKTHGLSVLTCRLRWSYSTTLGLCACIYDARHAVDIIAPCLRARHEHHEHDQGPDPGSHPNESDDLDETESESVGLGLEDALGNLLDEVFAAEDPSFLGHDVDEANVNFEDWCADDAAATAEEVVNQHEDAVLAKAKSKSKSTSNDSSNKFLGVDDECDPMKFDTEQAQHEVELSSHILPTGLIGANPPNTGLAAVAGPTPTPADDPDTQVTQDLDDSESLLKSLRNTWGNSVIESILAVHDSQAAVAKARTSTGTLLVGGSGSAIVVRMETPIVIHLQLHLRLLVFLQAVQPMLCHPLESMLVVPPHVHQQRPHPS